MENKTEITLSPPPRLMSSIITGFNSVANNIYLILFPILLDLFIWFGPHFRIKSLLQPFLDEMISSMTNLGMADFNDMIATTQEVWQATLSHFNLMIALRTFPIGIPSLLSPEGTLLTPLGSAPIFEFTSFSGALGVWILLSLLGIIAGSFFFRKVAIHSYIKKANSSEKQSESNDEISEEIIDHSETTGFGWQIAQSLGLTLTLFIFILLIMFPASFLLSLFAMINPLLAQVAILIVTFFALWLIIPMAFSPHGIFTYQHNFLKSLLISTRLVRFTLPLTSLFLLIVIVLNQGLNALWRLAPDTSWMRFVGVAGHAFISTGLLASSFVYYRSGISWIQDNIQKQSIQKEIKIP